VAGPPASDPDRDFLLQMQLTQLHHVTTNETAARGLAENYTGAFMGCS
jgi:hypothetical protein